MKTFNMALCAVAMVSTASVAQAGFPTTNGMRSSSYYNYQNAASSACADGHCHEGHSHDGNCADGHCHDGNCADGNCKTGERGQLGCADGSCSNRGPHSHFGTVDRPAATVPRSAGAYTPTATTRSTGYRPTSYQPTPYHSRSNCPGGVCPTHPRTNVYPTGYRGKVPSAACPNGNCPPTTYAPQQRYQVGGYNNPFGLRF
ncbi:MAG: hypothetical protein WBC44_11750 [Planctomycetaceae bacterium]